MATAAVAATATVQVILGWNASQLDRLVDVLLDGLLHLLQFSWASKKARAIGLLYNASRSFSKAFISDSVSFECCCFSCRLWPLAIKSSYAWRLLIAHERINATADFGHVRLIEDRLAKVADFLGHRSFFDCGMHIMSYIMEWDWSGSKADSRRLERWTCDCFKSFRRKRP
jgi:hypothetical protein